MKETIEIKKDISLKQDNKKIILEKGDRIKILEATSRSGWSYDPNDMAFEGYQTLTMEGNPEIVIVYLGNTERYAYQLLVFDKNGKLLKKSNYSKDETKHMIENFDWNYPMYTLRIEDLKLFIR